MSTPTQASLQFEKKPLLLRILVGLWALAAGSSIFDNTRVLVMAATGNWPTNQPMLAAVAWAGFGLLVAALLVAVCYAFFYLRRSAVRLYAIYLGVQFVTFGIYVLLNPHWLSSTENQVSCAATVVLAALTLVYTQSLKSRAVLA